MNTNLLRLRSGLIAKRISPKDTFNLARSIKTMNMPYGFDIVQEEIHAFYGEIINDGRTDRPLSAKEQGNVDWWDEKVFNGVTRFIATNQNNVRKEYQEIAGWAKKTPARQKAHMRSLARSGK